MVDITNKSDSEKKAQEQQEQNANRLASLVNLKFQASERARQSDEDAIWKGIIGADRVANKLP